MPTDAIAALFLAGLLSLYLAWLLAWHRGDVPQYTAMIVRPIEPPLKFDASGRPYPKLPVCPPDYQC